MAGNGEKRIASTANDLVFFTNTDESNYPIYITPEREVWLKAKPHRKVVEKPETHWEYESVKKIYDVPIIATFFVKSITETTNVSHDLHSVAVEAITEVSNNEPDKITQLEIAYEIYRGDMESLIGEAKAYTIKIDSRSTPFSGLKYEGRRAWAVGFDWKKRIIAKHPELQSFVYLKGEDGKHGRAYVQLCIKLPIATPELEKLFSLAVSSAQQKVGITSELEAQIQALRQLIEQKETELNTLREQLQQLELKLQLEKMKREVV